MLKRWIVTTPGPVILLNSPRTRLREAVAAGVCLPHLIPTAVIMAAKTRIQTNTPAKQDKARSGTDF